MSSFPLSAAASALALAMAGGLAGCATTAGDHPSYSEELQTLDADCRARGGVLAPAGGASTGRPQTENFCRITGTPIGGY